MCSSDDEALGPIRELARRGRKDQALAMLQSLLRENPDSVPALLWYAALTPDLEKGIRALERVLGLDPDNARARAGLNDLRARLSCQRDGGGGTSCYAPPAEGEPDTSRGEARHETPPVSMPSLVSGDEIVQLAGRVIWPFRGLNRPIQELLENGQIREQDLAWAGRKAYDPCVKWAAGVLLRREHLKGRQFSPEQMGALPWPYKELNRPLGELLCQGLVSLHDLAYALTQGREMLICAAAVLGYPIVQQLAGGAAPSLPIQAKPTLPTPEGAPPSPPREPESVKPARAPRRGPSPASDKVSPASPAPVREPLEIVSGSGYLGKELQAAREKRRKTVKWASCLVIAIASVAPIIVILLRLLGLPAQYALGISLAAIIGILFLLDRLTIPFLRRLKGEEEDFLAGKEGEDRLARLLWEHLDSCWTLFRNLVLPDRQDDIDAVLVGPQGLYALEVKAYRGFYRNVQDRWEYRQLGRWRPLSKNPTGQVRGNAARLGKYLAGILGEEVWVEPIIVWAGRGRIEFDKPHVRIWRLDRPDYWLPLLQGGKTLPAETVERTRVALRALCSTLR